MSEPSIDDSPADEALASSPERRRRRRGSSRRNAAEMSKRLKQRKRPLAKRLKAAWKRYRRVGLYTLLTLGIIGGFVATVTWLIRLNTDLAPKKITALTAPEAPQPGSRSGRGFSLTNLTKMDLAGERSGYGQTLKLNEPEFSSKEILAETAFKGRQFAEAEVLYRELLPESRRRSVVLYHIFLCILMQDRAKDAEELFPPNAQPSPAWFYARAALEYHNGNKAEAEALLQEARLNYPAFVSLYDPALRSLGFAP